MESNKLKFIQIWGSGPNFLFRLLLNWEFIGHQPFPQAPQLKDVSMCVGQQHQQKQTTYIWEAQRPQGRYHIHIATKMSHRECHIHVFCR